MTTQRDRPDHARDHPELAAGDQRRDVRGDAQDRDERDHLRGARHGHRRSPTATGNLASSGAGIPAFVGVLDKAVQRIIELQRRADEIRPGDVFITNDPFYGGVTHLNDVVLAMPVFAGDEIVAWTANIAHWNDVGGMVPGSISNEATRDLPGGPAAARRQADLRGRRRSAR